MDVTTIIPAIWKLMRKRKLTINITNIDNELSVSIIKKNKITRFTNTNHTELLEDIENYLAV